MPEQPFGADDHVTLRLPATSAYLSVLRTATASLASRLDFTLDDIEDLRIAVDEACALLLTRAVPDSDLTCRFQLGVGVLRVEVGVRTTDAALPSTSSFAWTVLTALAGEVDATVEGDLVTLRMVKHRVEAGAA